MVVKKSTCLFCSLKCGLAFRMERGQAVAIDYDKENPVNHGALCPRGYYNLELASHPARLTEPSIGQRKVNWEEAAAFIKQELKLFEKDAIGITVSSFLSNEDASLLTGFARNMGIKNICAVGSSADLDAYTGIKWDVPGARRASLEEIEKADFLLIVGDLLSRSPVLSKRINKVKYGKRGNKIAVIDPNKTHTTWFATEHLQNLPGTEAVVIAALLKAQESENDPEAERLAGLAGISPDRIKKVAADFKASLAGTIIFAPAENKKRNDLIAYLTKLLSVSSPNKNYATFYLYGNTEGVNSVLDREIPEHTFYREILNKIDAGEIKALLMFGEDLAEGDLGREHKFRMIKFSTLATFFPCVSSVASDTTVCLPLSGWQKALEISLEGNKEKSAVIQTPCENVDFNQKISEVNDIVPGEKALSEEITHFGNLAKNFFWYRVNNG